MQTRVDLIEGFFDKDAVLKAVDKAQSQALSKFGAFVRTRARSSLRKRKRPAQPGQPPSSHSGALKNNIFFAYDKNTRSVVIGPAKLNKVGDAPQALERGGQSAFRRNGRTVRASYKPRPFMFPALQAEAPQFPNLFANSVR